MHGKHVVLDQDSSLQSYFSDEGWRWDIKKPKVRKLLRSIREELMELCGDSGYFHIGCDESYIKMTKDNIDPFTLGAWNNDFNRVFRKDSFNTQCSIKTAELLRKVYCADGDYEKSGWAKYQVGINTD